MMLLITFIAIGILVGVLLFHDRTKNAGAETAPKTQPTREPSATKLTVSGLFEDFMPARNRPGCVLTLSSNGEKGYYYVPLSPHDVHKTFPMGQQIKLTVQAGAQPVDGVYDTIWDTQGS